MKKCIFKILFIVYIFIVILTTFTLMRYNNYGVIELKNRLFITPNKTNLDYNKFSLLILKKDKTIKTNETYFYYTADEHKILISKAEVKEIEYVTENEKTIILKNDKKYSDKYIISNEKNLIIIPLIGLFIRVFTSKMGYFILIIIPMFVFFIFQIVSLFKGKRKNEKKD